MVVAETSNVIRRAYVAARTDDTCPCKVAAICSKLIGILRDAHPFEGEGDAEGINERMCSSDVRLARSRRLCEGRSVALCTHLGVSSAVSTSEHACRTR